MKKLCIVVPCYNVEKYIDRYGSLCEPDIIDAFKRIGLEIVEESAEIYNKSIIPSESAALASSVLTKGGFAFAFTINFFPDRLSR